MTTAEAKQRVQHIASAHGHLISALQLTDRGDRQHRSAIARAERLLTLIRRMIR